MEIPTIALSTSFKLGYLINKPVLIFVFIFFLIIYIIISGILRYHWHNYGMRNAGIIFAQSLFFLVSIVLFVIMGLTIYYY